MTDSGTSEKGTVKLTTVPVSKVEQRVEELQAEGYDVVRQRPTLQHGEPAVEIEALKRLQPNHT